MANDDLIQRLHSEAIHAPMRGTRKLCRDALAELAALEEQVEAMREAFTLADMLVRDAINWGGYFVGEGHLEKLNEARTLINKEGDDGCHG